ncbi:hypothetical protein LLEC1_01605 [Akanthomyces lecanii]|uniref:Zn(2)-C6 fungal-type domain-containing protein n=1 Tax=Cordyceps confragosa TaxID=2714763 RepID=A0A179IJK1_CORDF|nr:hypothetical protein LLEC1_01605 [Akanthomyces lecanii]
MEPGPANRRRRPALACSQCRRRKIRCDRGFPCGPCLKSLPVLSCIYHSQPGGHAAAAASHPRAAQHHPRSKGSTQSLDLAKVNLPNFEVDAFAGLNGFSLDWRSSWPQSVGSSTGLFVDTAAEYFQDFSSNEYYENIHKEPFAINKGYSGESEATSSGSAPPSMGGSPGYGDDSWYERLAQIKKLQSLVNGIRGYQEQIKGRLVPPLPRECQGDDDGLRLPPLLGVVMKLEYSARLKKKQNDEQSFNRLSPLFNSSCQIRKLLPPRQACKKLVSAYFETFGSVLCILDTTKFFDDLDRFWEGQDATQSPAMGREETFAHKLLVVVALGSVVCPSSPGAGNGEAEHARQTSRRNHATVCVQHTREWLAQKTARGIRADLEMAQILCLLALARQTQLHTDPWPRRPSIDGTIILSGDHDLARLGMHMGLHREPRASSLGTPAKEADAQLRRRLWTTMLELSLHQYLDAELPPPLSAESYDSGTPSSSGMEDDPRSYLVQDYQRVPGSTILAALSRTQRLRLQALQQLYAPGAANTYQDSHNLPAELNKACNLEMKGLLVTGGTQPTSFQLWLFNALTRPFVLALSAPCNGEAENRFASYYSRRMRIETAVLMLRPSLHDEGPGMPNEQTPIHSSQAVSRSKTVATTYPFLPTPSTTEPNDASIGQHEWIHQAAITTLCVGGPSHRATVHRQVVATLCADIIAEIQDDLFPNLDAFTLQKVVNILEVVVNEFRTQVLASGGTDACRELILFAVAHSFSVALLNRSSTHKVNESIMTCLWKTLHHCCEAMGEQPEGFLAMDWEREAMEDATKPPRDATGMSNADDYGDIVPQMQVVDFVLEPQDDVQRLKVSAADTEIAEMWAFEDDESYFPVEISL